MDVTVSCPACGGTEFEERNTLECRAQLAGFTLKNGILRPVFSGSTEVDWNSQRAVGQKPLSCVGCEAEYGRSDLVATAVPETADSR
jgi:hypothetical protein